MQGLRLDSEERRALDRDGFLVRRDVFEPREVADMAAACEVLIERLLEEKRRTKWAAGAYVFEIQRRLQTAVKWEKDHPDVVQGIEPFAHLSEPLRHWAHDPRFLEPMRDLVGADEVSLFTEKLNVKRARQGGPIVLHQDHPYWVGVAEEPARVGTALLFLDDSTVANGCLEVVPGSHAQGEHARRPVEGFAQYEMDPERYDTSRLVPVELAAGSVVFFGPFLVHRSLPNRTDGDRRALLFSYQPSGHRHMREAAYLAE